MKKISKILTVDRIKDLKVVTKDEVLDEMCKMVADAPQVISYEVFSRAIRTRESIMSTGIGMGIAIPHAKSSSVTDFVMAVGRLEKGVDFQSLDDMPVYLIILIVASDTQGKEFLKLLGKIGSIFNDPENIKKFHNAKSPKEIFNLFKKLD